jgi:hypothetical protein
MKDETQPVGPPQSESMARREKALLAVRILQAAALARGTNRMTSRDIEAEINRARRRNN